MSDVLTECFGDAILSYLQIAASKSSLPHTDSNTTSLPPLTMAGLKQLFHHHLLQLRCNSHFVSIVISDNVCQESSEIVSTVSDGGHSAIETTSEKRLGSAVYPTASLMNHSCTPNAFFR
jgi:hypothetical protein